MMQWCNGTKILCNHAAMFCVVDAMVYDVIFLKCFYIKLKCHFAEDEMMQHDAMIKTCKSYSQLSSSSDLGNII